MLNETQIFNVRAFFEKHYLDIPTSYHIYYSDPIILDKNESTIKSSTRGICVLVKKSIKVLDV